MYFGKWPAEYCISLLEYQGLERTIRKKRVKKKLHSTGIDIQKIMEQKPLGKGEFGATYDFNDDTVVKVIKVLNKEHEASVLKEVKLHLNAQKLILPDDGFCCVPPIYFGPSKHIIGKQLYISFGMPRLNKFDMTQNKADINFTRIMNCCDLLVEKGYLHNDLHQGNIMMYQNKAVIIDLGLMITYTPPESEEILKCIKFAQSCALMDNCNNNTVCSQIIENKLMEAKKYVIKLFRLKKNRTIQQIMGEIEKHVPSEFEIIQSQLLLACLSTDFQKCGYLNICDTSKADYIYAIRNPNSVRETLKSIILKAKKGEDF